MLPRPGPLPGDLPVPVDTGEADHLVGIVLPPIELEVARGGRLRIDHVDDSRWLLFVYPVTGDQSAEMPAGWDQIPGARGCSQEVCSFRDSSGELAEAGVGALIGLTSDSSQFQRDLIAKFHINFPLVSDPELSLARAIRLPTFQAFGRTYYQRLTMVLRANVIEHVFFPVFPPETHAESVLEWIASH